MKDLKEHITDAILANLVESITSPKLVDVFTYNGKLAYQFKQWLSRGMQWDKITDEDIVELSPEEARNIAYKRNSNDYILWLDGEGKFMAKTVGNYLVLFEPINYNMKNQYHRNTVNSISNLASKAYLIPEKFDTREMRRIREEQKRGALALMDDAQVAKDNLRRYRDILNNKKINELNFGDVAERVTNTIDKFKVVIKNITDEAIATDDFKRASDDFLALRNDINSVITRFSDVLNDERTYKKFGREGFGQTYRNDLVKSIERLDQSIDAFNEKYVN